MDRAQKQAQVESLRDIFSDVETVVLASVEGLNAEQVTKLRGKMHQASVNFRVVKNNLARLALKDTKAEALADDFVGSTAIAWSKSDVVTPAKIVFDFKKEVESFKIKTGFATGKRLEFASLQALAELPSLDELRARLLGLMSQVPAQLLAQINAPATHVVGVLHAYAEKDKA